MLPQYYFVVNFWHYTDTDVRLQDLRLPYVLKREYP